MSRSFSKVINTFCNGYMQAIFFDNIDDFLGGLVEMLTDLWYLLNETQYEDFGLLICSWVSNSIP